MGLCWWSVSLSAGLPSEQSAFSVLCASKALRLQSLRELKEELSGKGWGGGSGRTAASARTSASLRLRPARRNPAVLHPQLPPPVPTASAQQPTLCLLRETAHRTDSALVSLSRRRKHSASGVAATRLFADSASAVSNPERERGAAECACASGSEAWAGRSALESQTALSPTPSATDASFSDPSGASAGKSSFGESTWQSRATFRHTTSRSCEKEDAGSSTVNCKESKEPQKRSPADTPESLPQRRSSLHLPSPAPPL